VGRAKDKQQRPIVFMAIINVEHTVISIIQHNESDYISLTDMVKPIENGSALIEKWLRNKNTIEFLGIWEGMYNPRFNSPEFEEIKNQADKLPRHSKPIEFDGFRIKHSMN
jgi:hypothetical protein